MAGTLNDALRAAFKAGAEWAFNATGINEGLTADEQTTLQAEINLSDQELIEWHRNEIARLCAKNGWM